MYKRRITAVLLSVALVIGGLSAGVWRVAAGNDSVSNHAQVYWKVAAENTDGMTHYHMEDVDGGQISIKQGQSGTGRTKRAVTLPERYDPRGTDAERPIRDQEDTGACWAFGALKALESDCVKKGVLTEEQADLSENHLSWYAYHHIKETDNPLYGDFYKVNFLREQDCYTTGGNALVAQFILANRWGAAWEEDAPFADKKTMASAMVSADSSLRFQSAIQMTDSDCYDANPDNPFNEEDRNAVKEAILEHGAMDVALYYSNTLLRYEDGVCSSYTDRHTMDDANHCVTIVGWDDSFDCFKTEAPAAGAWLIANSYGTEYNEAGYFWVSYYDTSLCEFYTFEGVAGDTYENAFQYDGIGWGAAIGSDQDIKIANVFTADTMQKLEAVSFYTIAENQPYTIDIYRNLQDSHPKSGELVERCSVSGIIERAGYHTVSLTEPIAVAAGETFSVVVTYYPVEGMTYAPVEGRKSVRDGMFYEAKEGQSHIYLAEDETWYDNTAVNLEGVAYNMNNVCVKVFSNPVSQEEYEEQQKSYLPASPKPDCTKTPAPTASPSVAPINSATPAKTTEPTTPPDTTGPTATVTPTVKLKIQCRSSITLGKGEKYTLPLTVIPASAKKSLRYSSTNSKIVSVSQTGKISAKKTGSAKITVQIGGTKKTITVKVKKAPKNITLRAGKTVLKKGKSTKLKLTLSKGSASYQVQYRSSNKKIATVSSAGTVTAKRKGTVKIRAISYNHKKATVKIRVVTG